MSNYDGAIAAILLVAVVAAFIAWLWISWVAIGMLMVYFGLPAEFLLQVFLWFIVNAIIGKFTNSN